MPTHRIRRGSALLPGEAGKADSSPIYIDSATSRVKVVPASTGSTEVSLHDSATDNLTTKNVGAVASNGGTVSVVEKGNGIVHQTIFTLVNMPLTLADATVGAGAKIYDFPEGVVTILGGCASVAETTTSVLANTLNTGVTYNYGVGTVTQSNGTLATTEQDIIPTTNGTASATINVAGAAALAARTGAPANFDGHSAAKSAFFNVGVATNTDIDGDATTLWSGTITISWIFNGDV